MEFRSLLCDGRLSPQLAQCLPWGTMMMTMMADCETPPSPANNNKDIPETLDESAVEGETSLQSGTVGGHSGLEVSSDEEVELHVSTCLLTKKHDVDCECEKSYFAYVRELLCPLQRSEFGKKVLLVDLRVGMLPGGET